MITNNKNRRPSRRREVKSEFDQKIIDIRRVARVMKGGRRFSFRVAVAIGDRKGRVGVGIGKSNDTSLAIEKAFRNAKKNLITPVLTKDFSVPVEIESKFASAKILIKPGSRGHGIVAGSSVRTVLDLAGIKKVNAKIISRSKNKLNIARATIKALKSLGQSKKKTVKASVKETKETKEVKTQKPKEN